MNGGAVTDFLRLVTGVPDLVWSGSRALASRPDTEPEARSAGVELELAAQPTAFFDFAVSASVADARL